MLIISINMFVRKKIKLRIAYSLLIVSVLAAIAHDARLRSSLPLSSTQTQPDKSPELALPFTITPLAQSPFPEARPNRFDANLHPLAHAESTPVRKQERHTPPAGVYFLTVAVQVDSGGGPVAFDRGTRVRLVRRQGGKLLVRHNGTDFLIEKSQVTDDLNALATRTRNSS